MIAALRTVAITFGLALGACSPEAPTDGRLNLLLITVDTLRADHLSSYGYERATSPAMDQLAATGVLFEQAHATSSWTLPSLASLIGSAWPMNHRCLGDNRPLPKRIETLAEHLSKAGYRTGAIANHIFLGRRYQMDQGYADYDDELALRFTERIASHKAITSEAVTDKAIGWLDGQASTPGPWHLWLHYFDPHFRYQAHPEHPTSFDLNTPEDLYDGEIAFTDHHIGRLFDYLKQAGLAEDTAIVLVSDHGEEFQEHGGSMHRRTLFEEVLRVPLIIKVPGLPSGRVSTSVSIVDVAPTLLELAGIAPSLAYAGTSLVPALRGERMAPRPHTALLSEPNIKLEALIQGDWKLIRDHKHGRTLLFNLVNDPLEQDDLASNQRQLCISMQRTMVELRKAASEQSDPESQAALIQLNQADSSTLNSLGYGGGDDPQEK